VAVKGSWFSEWLASYESVLDTARRNVDIARGLAEAYRSGLHPPEYVIDAYLASFERDSAHLADLRAKLGQLKATMKSTDC
jgi:hypothetical protein